MKLFLATILLLAGLLTAAQAQQAADEKYLRIYELIQQGDELVGVSLPGEALVAFTTAETQLQLLRKTFPDWNPAIINFRLHYLEGKIADLKGQGVTGTAPVKKTEPPASTPSDNAAPPMDALNAQLQSLRAENETLQAKLREALAPQPTAVDPLEFARAQEQIRNLMKENELLKVSHPEPAAAVPPEKIIVTDTNKLNQARMELAEVARKLSAEHDRAEKLAVENDKLQQDLKAVASPANPAALAALRAQNAKLQEQFDTLRAAAVANAPEVAKLTAELKDARAQIASLKAANSVAALENKALENKLAQTAKGLPPDTAAAEARIRSLSQERDELLAKLAAASQKKSGNQNDAVAAQIAALNDQVKTLQSRIAVDEAKAVPYSAEELALFRQPSPVAPGRKSIKELPAGTAELVASAQQHFAKREFDQAEADYQKILDRDQNNGLALANLATIELQENKLAEAEKHIQAAVAQSPDDAYNLSTLGYLKFRQEKYDEALTALSRATTIDPENPEIQNYLGVTLSHKGLRAQGETALRKAIQLNASYAPAHNNLAVIYLNQDPSLPQLARWHYQKALDAGQPRNPDLEKMLADKGAPVAAPAEAQ